MNTNILAIDIGNSHTVYGLFESGRLVFTARSVTDGKKTSDDIAVTLMGIFTMNRKDIGKLGGTVVSSVVPKAGDAHIAAIERLSGKKPLIAGPDTAGLEIKVEYPERVGSDRLSTAAAAVRKYTGPLIILDLGTATTVNVIDGKGGFIGGCICPGVMTSIEALASVTAQLPRIDINNPGPLIGKNTVDSMKSGIVYGTASMLDGIIERMEEELGTNATAIATGGLAKSIIGCCRKNIIYDPNLLLEGLYHIYLNNDNNIQKGVQLT